MKDFELQLRLRNNRLKARRLALGLSSRELAEKTGVSPSDISAYENMRLYPLVKSRKVGRKTWGEPDTWRVSANKLAFFFKCPCEELWPDVILAVKKPVVTTEVDSKQLALLSGFEEQRLLEASPPPDEVAEAVELAEAVDGVLATLTPREEEVLRLRFGLGDEDEHTNDEVGEKIGPVSRERARCIESSALRKLRHPSRSKYLTSFVKPECVGTMKLKGPKCARCASDFTWEGTQDWKFPVCYDCWVHMDKPEEEPGLQDRDIR